jgi:hypothetical protein
MVKSPAPTVSVAASRAEVIAPPCSGNNALPFGVDLEDSDAKSLTVPNGTG